MIGEFEMRAGQIDLRHVARSAVLRRDFAARRRVAFARLPRLRGLRDGARSASGFMAGQAFCVVISFVRRRRFMRVVTRRAAYPAIVGVTFAAEDAIRLE